LRCLVGLAVLLVPCIALTADDRPETLAQAGGNPLALNAVAFLGWYWKLLLVLAGVAVLLRLFGGELHARARPPGMLGEDPYAMAYLAGGEQRVLDAAMASLVEQGALRVNAVTRELIAEGEPSEDRPKIERLARRLLGGARRVEDAARFRRWLQQELDTPLALMRERLLRAGLLARPPLQAKAVTPLRLAFIALLGVGSIRLIAGVAAGRPVGFLVISMLLTGLVAWWLLRGMGGERATARGKQLLDDRKSRLGRGGDDRIWTVALLGLTGHGMGPMADLHHVIQVPRGRSLFGGGGGRGRGDSFGAGGCTGDTSGGGDCGGGGCGGGGCGGCGG